MNYNFDEIINRNGTDSVKWDGVEGRWGRKNVTDGRSPKKC